MCHIPLRHRDEADKTDITYYATRSTKGLNGARNTTQADYLGETSPEPSAQRDAYRIAR